MEKNKEESVRTLTPISWYPGHMHKTKKEIKENLKYVDIVYEIIDARIPKSSKIEDIDSLIGNKIKILIMTKKDLCDIDVTNKWVKHYENKNYNVLLLDLTNNLDIKKLIKLTSKLTKEIIFKRVEKGIINKEVKALVVGVPNVGKSTIINALASKKVAKVGNIPGVTKHVNWLKTKTNILIMDTPGILWPKLSNEIGALNLAAFGAIRPEVLNLNDIGKHILNHMKNYYPTKIETYYNLDNLENLEYKIAAKFSYIINSEIDYENLYKKIYHDLNANKFPEITFDKYE